jgi:hypothetical protein
MLGPSAGTLRCIECGESQPRAGADSVFAMGSRGFSPTRKTAESAVSVVAGPNHGSGLVSVETNRCSVPFMLIGQPAEIHRRDGQTADPASRRAGGRAPRARRQASRPHPPRTRARGQRPHRPPAALHASVWHSALAAAVVETRDLAEHDALCRVSPEVYPSDWLPGGEAYAAVTASVVPSFPCASARMRSSKSVSV